MVGGCMFGQRHKQKKNLSYVYVYFVWRTVLATYILYIYLKIYIFQVSISKTYWTKKNTVH